MQVDGQAPSERQQVRELFQRMDRDSDGNVTLKEFCCFVIEGWDIRPLPGGAGDAAEERAAPVVMDQAVPAAAVLAVTDARALEGSKLHRRTRLSRGSLYSRCRSHTTCTRPLPRHRRSRRRCDSCTYRCMQRRTVAATTGTVCRTSLGKPHGPRPRAVPTRSARPG